MKSEEIDYFQKTYTRMKNFIFIVSLFFFGTAFAQANAYSKIDVRLNNYGDSIIVSNKGSNIIALDFMEVHHTIGSLSKTSVPVPTEDGYYRLRAYGITYHKGKSGYTQMSKVFYFFDVTVKTEDQIRSVTIR
jgi:hypothetical protein